MNWFGRWNSARRVSPLYPVSLFLLAFAVTLSLPTSADYLGSYLTLECDTDQNSAVVLPLGAWSPIPETPPHLDCTFKNGRHVRAKYGEGPPDKAGLPSTTWLSVWIDRAKVVSSSHFACWGEGRCGIYFEISTEGLKTCRVEPDSVKELEFKAVGEYKCEFTPNTALATTVDTTEFPERGIASHQEPGSVAVLSGEKQFCRSFVKRNDYRKKWEVSMPADSLSPPQGEHSNGGYEYMSFDIDNDGKPDDVYHGASGASHLPSEHFHVYQKGKNSVARSWPRVDHSTFANDNDHVTYPTSWSYDVGYFFLTPVIYRGKTYMLLVPYPTAEHGGVTRLLMPQPGGKATEICSFSVVQDNY